MSRLPRRRYRSVSTSVLRVWMRVLAKVDVGGLCRRQVAEIDLELTLREIDAEADKSGGYLVAWILGEQ